MTLKHGGNLIAAAAEFGIPETEWIDLSTGISPWSWPVPPVPESVWRDLPNDGDGLEAVAADYYGCRSTAVLPVAGSQYAIQTLPALIEPARVAMPLRGYAEHEFAWRNNGHDVVYYTHALQLQAMVESAEVDHAVVINPNNPTGELIAPQVLMALCDKLAADQGKLFVDEAFMDVQPTASIAPQCPREGLIVLRSIGKFFGLAGIRLGFVLADKDLLEALRELMPPWQVSNVARWVGSRALANETWHKLQRDRLNHAHGQWLAALEERLPLRWASTQLFASGIGEAKRCDKLFNAMARRGLLVRLHDVHAGQGLLRLGLPHPDKQSLALEIIEQAAEEVLCAPA